MKKPYIIFAIIIIVASGLVYLFRAGWYPLAIVNSELVWGWQLDKEHRAANQYLEKAVKTYDINNQAKNKDLRMAALNNIIERLLITDGFQKLSKIENSKIIEDKISKYQEDIKLSAAASTLFNLTSEEFLALVIVPQAEKEALAETLKDEGRDLDQWLDGVKKKAKIYLFTEEFRWVDGRLIY